MEMKELEKVIKGLEVCSAGLCEVSCPYHKASQCTRVILTDALELLKAQRETIDELISADKLLKEQTDEIKELRSMVEFWKEKALHT